MKKWIKRILIIVFLVSIAAFAICAPTINKGYKMYKTATEKISVEDMVEKMRANPDYVKIEGISSTFLEALLHSEDRRFYYHYAIDPIALTRAVIANISSGKYSQGGSTITQQLAKNMYFSFEKRVERKIAELFVAFQLENKYTKDEILELYCNQVYFGENCYGVKQASAYFYHTTPQRLNETQSEDLVSALKAPSLSNPSTQAE
ncbi:MAG: biosynthetic peptidoglycan transglycosylase [Oscillospiraceae bacterium]